LGGKIDKFLTKSVVKRLKNKLEWKNYIYFFLSFFLSLTNYTRRILW
jgi:hypothetical protein